MTDKTSAWADKATMDDIAAHIAANGSSAIGRRLLEIAREQAGELERLREFARDIRDGWDCDNDAHRYGTPCRCCEAEKVIGTKK